MRGGLVSLLILWLAGSVVVTGYTCPDGWFVGEHFTTCIKLFEEKKSWPEARTACQDVGGDLVKILNAGMNELIADKVWPDKNHAYWIGLNDQKVEDKFVWLDEPHKATYDNWYGTQPNGKGRGQDCVGINYPTFTKGKWDDFECWKSRKFICERTTALCPNGWSLSEHSDTCVKLFDEKKSWPEARGICQSVGADLVKILNSGMNQLIADKVWLDKGGPHWIGLNYRRTEDTFVWLDENQKATYVSRYLTQPHGRNNRQDCVGINYPTYPKGKWDWFQCQQSRKFICERPKAHCRYGWFISEHSDTCIKLSEEKKSWPEARTACQDVGGDLVKILNAGMNELIADNVGYDRGQPYWIGLNDRRKEDTFVWLDEYQNATYLNWFSKQPNGKHSQNCVGINYSRFFKGKWDYFECRASRKFICERPQAHCPDGWMISEYFDTCIKLSEQSKSWREARSACQDVGADLVKILDTEMNQFIADKVWQDVTRTFWIGLNDIKIEDKFVWLDQNHQASYVNWWKTEHNNDGDCVAINHPEGAMGTWGDFLCDESRKFVCERHQACQDGFYGVKCTQRCHANCKTCGPTTALCYGDCRIGWRGEDCLQRCRDGTYGEGCRERCHVNCRTCDHITGWCHEKCNSGWVGVNCLRECPDGYYGDGCRQLCHVNCETCDHITGLCNGKCKSGWLGQNCLEKCPDGSYGHRCSLRCHDNCKTCGQTSGHCNGDCKIGWRGADCLTECPDGHYGYKCRRECHVNCRRCDHITGHCDGECKSGWIGKDCTQKCPDGSYGDVCSQRCHANCKTCNHTSGFCNGDCKTGWIGPDCIQGMHIADVVRQLPVFKSPLYIRNHILRQKYQPPPAWNSTYCTHGFIKSEHSGTCIKVFALRASWIQARRVCKGLGADLVKILNSKMNQFIADKVSSYRSQPYWIGLNDHEHEGKFVWLDESYEATYVNWPVRQNPPNDRGRKQQNCVVINYRGLPEGTWDNNGCRSKRKFICEKLQVTCPDGWLISEHSGTCIQLVEEKKSWSQSRKTCHALGADLVTILNASMNKFITDTVSSHERQPFWIGLNDRRVENKFVWLNRSSEAKYFNWATEYGQPNNFGATGQDCVDINYPTYRNGLWGDSPCSEKRKFICERWQERVLPGEKCKATFMNVTNATITDNGDVFLARTTRLCSHLDQLMICLDEATDSKHWMGSDRSKTDTLLSQILRETAYQCGHKNNKQPIWKYEPSSFGLDFKRFFDLNSEQDCRTMYLGFFQVFREDGNNTKRNFTEDDCTLPPRLTSCTDGMVDQYLKEKPQNRLSSVTLTEVAGSINMNGYHVIYWYQCGHLYDVLKRILSSPCSRRDRLWDLGVKLKDCDGEYNQSMAEYNRMKSKSSSQLCRIYYRNAICWNNVILNDCGYEFALYQLNNNTKQLYRHCQTPDELGLHFDIDCYALKECNKKTFHFSLRTLPWGSEHVQAYCKTRQVFKDCWTRYNSQCQSEVYKRRIEMELRILDYVCPRSDHETMWINEPSSFHFKGEQRICKRSLSNVGLTAKTDLCEFVTSLVLCIIDKVYSRPGRHLTLDRLIEHLLVSSFRRQLKSNAGQCVDMEEIDNCNNPNPCRHGGTCVDLYKDFSCVCKKGYTGKNCFGELCKDQTRCLNGGVCIVTMNREHCWCPAGYQQKRCSKMTDVNWGGASETDWTADFLTPH